MRVRLRAVLAFFTCLLLFAPAARAQEVVPAVTLSGSHPFGDQANLTLFGLVAAARALDFASTRHFRARGLNEWLLTNRIVDNTPLFAGIEVAGVAASIGVSYLCHRTNHHRLERWVSLIHFGGAVSAAAHNYSLKAPPSRGPMR